MLDHFSLLAPLYERVMRPKDVTRLRALLRLPTGGLLLDVGGGTGRVSRPLAGEVDGVVIADLAPGMLRQAADSGTVSVVLAPAQALPFRNGAFARVLAVDSFHHLGNQAAALREMVRVLSPDGWLVIEEPDIRRWRVKAIAVAERLALMQSRFIAPARIAAMLGEFGLAADVVETGGVDAWVVARYPVG